MDRTTSLYLIALFLVVYGLYHLLNGLAVGSVGRTPVLAILFLLQGVLGIGAAYGTWRSQPWTPQALLALGVVVAATALIEAFILGIIGWLWALLIAVVAIVVAMLLAAYVQGARQS
jgi:hypothetical protein